MAGLDWDALQDQVAAGGCVYESVLKAIVNVLVDKSVMSQAEVAVATADVAIPVNHAGGV
jgi:hypothetical protein